MYFLENYGGSKLTVRREDNTGSQIWITNLNKVLSAKSFTILPDETEVIFSRYSNNNAFGIVRLNAADGVLIQHLETNDYFSQQEWLQAVPTSDNNNVYFSGYHSSNDEPVICKLILGDTDIDCFTATGMSKSNMAFTLISDTELFMIWVKDVGPMNMIFQRLTWSSTSPAWSYEVTCPDGSLCSHGYAHALMSADNTQVYTLTSFGQTKYAYFIVLDSLTGNVVQGDAPLIFKSSSV